MKADHFVETKSQNRAPPPLLFIPLTSPPPPPPPQITQRVSWLVVFGLNDPLRQYFSLYRVVSQREGERRERIDESKNVQTTPPAPTTRAVGPCPTLIQTSKTPRHWKFTQDHRTTRSPPTQRENNIVCIYNYVQT